MIKNGILSFYNVEKLPSGEAVHTLQGIKLDAIQDFSLILEKQILVLRTQLVVEDLIDTQDVNEKGKVVPKKIRKDTLVTYYINQPLAIKSFLEYVGHDYDELYKPAENVEEENPEQLKLELVENE